MTLGLKKPMRVMALVNHRHSLAVATRANEKRATPPLLTIGAIMTPEYFLAEVLEDPGFVAASVRSVPSFAAVQHLCGAVWSPNTVVLCAGASAYLSTVVLPSTKCMPCAKNPTDRSCKNGVRSTSALDWQGSYGRFVL